MNYESLKSMVERRFSIRSIASTTGLSPTSVAYWLKKHKLKTKKKVPTYRCKCGETNREKFYGHKTQICSKCSNEDNLRRGQENRELAIQQLGGKCTNCGYSKFSCSLDIHHTDPTKKDKAFASCRGWAWERWEKEIQHCILLCRNCHQAYHCGLVVLPNRDVAQAG